MAFETMNDDMNIIAKLPDEPNDEGGMTAGALKATFDKAGMLAKTAINKLIAALGASTAAGNIGFAPTAGVPKTNVQDAIENVQSQIAGVAMGEVPNGSVTAEKLAGGAVTAEKVAPGAIAFLDVSDQYQINPGLATDGTTGAEVLSYEFRFLPALGVVAFSIRLSIETQGKAAIHFVADGPYTPRYNAQGEAASASLTGSHLYKNLGVGFCADFIYVESSGKRYMDMTLCVSDAVDCAVAVSGWFFAHEAEVT